MNTAAMVTTWITENGAGDLAQYNVPAAAAMLQRWADEDCNGVVSALDGDTVASVVESYRGAK